MTKISTVLDEIEVAIQTIMTGSPAAVKYTVKRDKIDQSLVESTRLPMVLVSSVRTDFKNSGTKELLETYNISLLLLIDKANKNDDVDTGIMPLDALVEAQDEILKVLMTQFVFNKSSCIVKGSFEVKTSSISNATKQHNFGSAISCMVDFTVQAVADYSI